MRAIFSLCALEMIASAASAADKSQEAKPVGNTARLFTADQYPDAARDAGEQGSVTARIDIDTSGFPTACTIVESSKSAMLDEATCRIARARMQFSPARDQRGKPLSSRYVLRVNWQLPKDGSTIIDLTSGRRKLVDTTVEYAIDTQGLGLKCRVVTKEPDSPDPCLNFVSGRRAPFPVATIDGEFSPALYTVRTIVVVDRPDPPKAE